MVFFELAHILWETTKPTIVLTENESVTRCFGQTKAVPASLWKTCDYVLQFNFKIAHIVGSVNNTAADFLIRLELKATNNIHLKIQEDIKITPIDLTTSSSDAAFEEVFFLTHADNEKETEEQTLERKKQSLKKATERVAIEEPGSMNPSIKVFTKIDGNSKSSPFIGTKANSRIRVEQNADLVLKI